MGTFWNLPGISGGQIWWNIGLAYFHSKRHEESNKTNENDWKWLIWLIFATFVEKWLILKTWRDYFSEVDLHIDRCRICYLYWEMFIVHDKNRKLANYGWFLEILGKMADSNSFQINRCTIYNFYWEMKSILGESQKLTDYGWFLEN